MDELDEEADETHEQEADARGARDLRELCRGEGVGGDIGGRGTRVR